MRWHYLCHGMHAQCQYFALNTTLFQLFGASDCKEFNWSRFVISITGAIALQCVMCDSS